MKVLIAIFMIVGSISIGTSFALTNVGSNDDVSLSKRVVIGDNSLTPGKTLTVNIPTTTSEGMIIKNGFGSFEMINLQSGTSFAPTLRGTSSGVGSIGMSFRGSIFPSQDTGSTPVITIDGRQTDNTPIENRPLLRVMNTGTALMTITPSGNVGIGVTSPSEKLIVNGNIKLTGNILSDNDVCIGTCP